MKDSLRSVIVDECGVIGVFCKGYIFGAALYSKRPQDIDILLVYEEGENLSEIESQVRRVGNELSCRFQGLPTDIVVLSTAELEETRFLEVIGNTSKFR